MNTRNEPTSESLEEAHQEPTPEDADAQEPTNEPEHAAEEIHEPDGPSQQPDGPDPDPATSEAGYDESTTPPQADASAAVEAILFTSDSPLGLSKIASVAELTQGNVRKAVKDLNARYDDIGASFRIEEIAGGYRMMTRPEYHDLLKRLLTARKDSRLSQAALETLAIIAYRQPILRADIEAIRGVACGEVLRGLLEKQLVKIVGRAEVIGRPMLYGTTRRFLEIFGLASLDDLPRVEELRSGEDAQASIGQSQSQETSAETEDAKPTEGDQKSTATPVAQRSAESEPPSDAPQDQDDSSSPDSTEKEFEDDDEEDDWDDEEEEFDDDDDWEEDEDEDEDD